MYTPVDDATPAAAAPTDAERRAALRTLGALAALTPPAVLTLLLSPRASAASVGGPPMIEL
ncbi:hypothetical protein [uncultured Thiodictyon sp.]|jgi:hypothetical protein|uniref:hypothetical protein n=1 Tax=uncultured Thiodictyon sp. TaxID=1846217 RepID=UPI0025F75E1E|nr:hypothetical protein [uncultured Thiodictyon sp.]